MRTIKQRLKIEPLGVALVMAFLAGLILMMYDVFLPTRFANLGADAMALSAAVDQSLVVLFLMIVLIIVVHWTAEKTHLPAHGFKLVIISKLLADDARIK